MLDANAPAPALWQVESPSGDVEGWLFGTVHSLPDNFQWRSAKLARAIEQAETLTMEVAAIDDDSALSAIFGELAASEGMPPLSQRVRPQYRAGLRALLSSGNYRDSDFSATETWAAALMLAQINDESEPENGVDRALLADFRGKPKFELEGARKQLGIFDGLPEEDQRDLLEAVIAESAVGSGDKDRELSEIWRRGDMERLALENSRSLLADPELRQALLVDRNNRWLGKIEAFFPENGPTMIAVGAAHLAGEDGLPALLSAKGYRLTRIQ